MKSIKKYIEPTLSIIAVIILSLFVSQIASSGNTVPAAANAATSTPVVTATPQETANPQSTTPQPTNSPTPTPLPCDFLTADFTTPGNADILERLIATWGFGYYKPDGKWAADDTYELTLFQRWAGLQPDGGFGDATRNALLSAYLKYGEGLIPRAKLPLEGRYIGINAGHQHKADSGLEPLSPEKNSPKKARVSSGTQGVTTRVPEYKVNLAVSLKLRDTMEAQGARVLMVRTTDDVRISNVERCRMMNDAGVDVYISLHCDGNNNHATHGLHTLIPADRGYQHGSVLLKSQQFAAIIQEEAIKATNATDKGFSTRGDLSSFNWSEMPTCLVEMGFMTYSREDKLLVSEEYQNKLAKGLAAGLTRYFNEVK